MLIGCQPLAQDRSQPLTVELQQGYRVQPLAVTNILPDSINEYELVDQDQALGVLFPGRGRRTGAQEFLG